MSSVNHHPLNHKIMSPRTSELRGFAVSRLRSFSTSQLVTKIVYVQIFAAPPLTLFKSLTPDEDRYQKTNVIIVVYIQPRRAWASARRHAPHNEARKTLSWHQAWIDTSLGSSRGNPEWAWVQSRRHGSRPHNSRSLWAGWEWRRHVEEARRLSGEADGFWDRSPSRPNSAGDWAGSGGGVRVGHGRRWEDALAESNPW